jgi:hypothetical protein
LLLDGLDEVKDSARSQCIEAINLYREERFAPLVVCSRRDEYATQHAQLALSSAVEIQPLQEQEVMVYLKGIGKLMATVRAALRSNPVLKQLLTTPRWLSLVILTYRDKAIRDLPLLGTAEQQKQHILERYVGRMLEQRTTKGHSTSKQARHWLIWLAQQMQKRSQTEFFLEQMQPDWLPNKRSRRIVVVVVIVLIFVAFAEMARVLDGLSAHPLGGGPGSAVIVWPLLGVIFGLLQGAILARGKSHARGLKETGEEIQPVELLWSWDQIRIGLSAGLLVAGLGLLLIGFTNWGLSFGLLDTLRCALGGILVGVWVGIVRGGVSGKRLENHQLVTPNRGIWRSAQNGALYGLSVASLLFLGTWLVWGSLGNLGTGFAAWLLFGLGSGLTFGGGACVQHFVLRWKLKQEGSLPWHYVHFLEEVTERALLQRIGGGYSFIPPLQDYFASFGTEISAGAQPHPSSLQP